MTGNCWMMRNYCAMSQERWIRGWIRVRLMSPHEVAKHNHPKKRTRRVQRKCSLHPRKTRRRRKQQAQGTAVEHIRHESDKSNNSVPRMFRGGP